MKQMIPLKKQSKKAQKEQHAKQRGSWYGTVSYTHLDVYKRQELERANKMLAAVKDIYRRGTVWSTALSPNVTVEADQETAYPATINGQEYLQQIFTVTSETWVCNYAVNVAFSDPSAVPAGTKIVDMDNKEIDVITTCLLYTSRCV